MASRERIWNKSDIVATCLSMEIAASHLPSTQGACCRLAARIAIQVHGMPQTEGELLAAAEGGAKGLFGEAFERAGDNQQSAWVCMYEAALRGEMEKHKAN